MTIRKPDESASDLTRLLETLGETVLEQALVCYLGARKTRERWGLLIRGEQGLHLLYGEEKGWADRLMSRGSGEQHRISVTYAEIETIQPPPPVSPLKRWFQGPTRPASIRLKNGDVFTLDVDREGETLLANARDSLRG